MDMVKRAIYIYIYIYIFFLGGCYHQVSCRIITVSVASGVDIY